MAETVKMINRADRDERRIDEIERMLETSVVAVIPESWTVKRALENEEMREKEGVMQGTLTSRLKVHLVCSLRQKRKV